MRRASRSPASQIAVALFVAALASTPSCGKPAPPPSTTAAPSSRPPPDQIAPGELAEGHELAFGLAVPRRMKVKASFPDAVHAVGDVPREDVANYVRNHVRAAAIETGPAKTVFAGVTLATQPGKTLHIEVSGHDRVTELRVSDRTPPPVDRALSPDERMRNAGLRPDGRPLDPTRLE